MPEPPHRLRIDPAVWIIVLAVAMVLMAVIRYSRKGTTMTEIPANTDRRAKIRAGAYAIWEEEGRPDGKHLEHWVRAKRQIVAEELHAAAETPTQFLRKPQE